MQLWPYFKTLKGSKHARGFNFFFSVINTKIKFGAAAETFPSLALEKSGGSRVRADFKYKENNPHH